MPRAYPPEFRARAIALVRAVKPQKQIAQELDIHPVTLSKWIKQDRIDRGGIPGVSTTESAEPRAARRRIRELETGLVIVRLRSSSARTNRDNRLYPVIDRLVDAGIPADRCCRVLGVTRQNYYSRSGNRPPRPNYGGSG